MRQIRRTWYCKDCHNSFKSFDIEPACPVCQGESRPPTPPARSDLPAPALLHDPTKIRTEIAETLMVEHGMTNMRDNQREGDIAAPGLSIAQQKMLASVGGSMFQRPANIAAQVANYGVGNNSGIPKDHAMKTVQNLAKQLEGRP